MRKGLHVRAGGATSVTGVLAFAVAPSPYNDGMTNQSQHGAANEQERAGKARNARLSHSSLIPTRSCRKLFSP